MKSKSEFRHDARVRELEQSLVSDGAFCQTFVQWEEGGQKGEIDLFAIYDTLPPQYEFYEVKCQNVPVRRKKAREQYRRFIKAYGLNDVLVKGFMTTCVGEFIRL